jgi:23S rRNA (cytidine1920-2'-O)/16S rRNA (cytidine1409-2'-O)-methyltransferase
LNDLRTRLDLALARRENISRNKAAEMIESGVVRVSGVLRNKPSFITSETDAITTERADRFASRSAYKLLGFLEAIALDVSGLDCLDVGASAGGWTQVLLERGAAQVTAIDVGENQLNPILRADTRVRSMEKTDIRLFAAPPFDLVVCDASFISLEKIVGVIDALAKDKIIALFKPQFEVGRAAKRDKNDVVVDQKAIEKAALRFENAASALGWILQAKLPSAIKGKKGNLEYLFYYRKIVR